MGGGETWSVCNAPEAALKQLGDHIEAEMASRKTHEQPNGGSRTVEEFKLRPRVVRNDHLDNFVACSVLASIEGCRLADHEAPRHVAREPIVVAQWIDLNGK